MVHMIGGPPGAGECKLRIKSDGTCTGTRVLIVDDLGVERDLLGAMAVSWKLEVGNGELATACVRVDEADVELDAEKVDVRPADEATK